MIRRKTKRTGDSAKALQNFSMCTGNNFLNIYFDFNKKKVKPAGKRKHEQSIDITLRIISNDSVSFANPVGLGVNFGFLTEFVRRSSVVICMIMLLFWGDNHFCEHGTKIIQVCPVGRLDSLMTNVSTFRKSKHVL